jgi:uncharacterized membrane protein
MAKKAKESVDSGKDDTKLFAFLATFLSIVGFIIALVAKKNDDYVMFYAKQSLVLFIASVIVSIAQWILLFIPIIGWTIMWVLQVGVAILWIISWLYALSGEKKEVPLVGKYARNIKL